MGHCAFWELGRGQLLAVFSGIHLFKQRNQVFWIADVCLEAGPGDEHTLPFDKGQGGSCRKACLGYNATAGGGWLHVALGPFQRLQGDPREALGCFHCEEEKDRGDDLVTFKALACSGR